ncbi:hypothetical protein [Chlamydia felis Fe/C-56]|uniref:Inclusion membrane protein n=1 Tax=Chlamydia felis (strain Fe/C-56) TaxID=264202 RepID=Q254K8_CHLFF|nr:hypothetical protein [Chlamydia felis]BAE81280.1 hypothetical protein [Chlamydia felis Fe/C-56]
MSPPTINQPSREDNPASTFIEVGTIIPGGRGSACEVRRFQVISLISALVAAILLLAILVLQFAPGVSIAFSVVLGMGIVIAAVVSLVSFATHFLRTRKVLLELANASAELRDAFANFSLDLIRSIEPQKITRPPKYGLRTWPTGAGLVVTRETTPAPDSLIPSLIPPETISDQTLELGGATSEETLVEGELTPVLPEAVSRGDTPLSLEFSDPIESAAPQFAVLEPEVMDVNALFQRNLLRLLDLAETGNRYPSLERHPKYQKEHRESCKAFSNLCQGIFNIYPKLKKGENPLTTKEMSLLVTPILCRNKNNHPVFRITCNAKAIFSSPTWGAFWLHDSLNNPGNLEDLFRIIHVLKQSNQNIEDPENRRKAYTATLISINILLSGWCLCNQNLAENIVGSIQVLPVSNEIKMLVCEMLNSGNVLGALVLLHGNKNPEIKSIMCIDDVDAGDSSQRGPDMLFEAIDPYSVRAITVIGDLAERGQTGDEDLAVQARRILNQLGDQLPGNLLGLAAYLFQKGDAGKTLAETLEFFAEHPPTSTSMIFSFLQAIREAPKLQSCVKTYLPYAGKEAVGSILSTLILGGYTLGLFTYKQIDGLCGTLGISDRELIRLIQSGKIAETILPNLLK